MVLSHLCCLFDMNRNLQFRSSTYFVIVPCSNIWRKGFKPSGWYRFPIWVPKHIRQRNGSRPPHRNWADVTRRKRGWRDPVWRSGTLSPSLSRWFHHSLRNHLWHLGDVHISLSQKDKHGLRTVILCLVLKSYFHILRSCAGEWNYDQFTSNDFIISTLCVGWLYWWLLLCVFLHIEKVSTYFYHVIDISM